MIIKILLLIFITKLSCQSFNIPLPLRQQLSQGNKYCVFQKRACVCTVDSPCPQIQSVGDLPQNVAAVYKTSKDSKDRLTRYEVPIQNTQSSFKSEFMKYKISINPKAKHQTLLGFGGALTDAAAINFNKMSQETQNQLIQAYYGKSGIQYTLGRVPIASTDFSSQVYSYAPEQNDYELLSFSIDVDFTNVTGFKLPFIKRVLENTERELSLFASIWAPPAWMTKQNSTLGNPQLRDQDIVKKSYSRYFRKFFEEYEKNGVHFWGVTAQNQPQGNLGTWQDLKFSASEQRDFIKSYMGPELRSYNSELKIMAFDDQRSSMTSWVNTVLGDQQAAQYVDGIAVHWYTSMEDRVVDFTRPFQKMAQASSKFPEKFILATEACTGYLPWDNSPILGDWRRGEIYGYDILMDLRSEAIGWTDWNIMLDMNGAPNWAKNYVDAPILVDTQDGNKFYKQPMFFYMGHFSKFLKKGDTRIQSQSEGVFAPYNVAFETASGQIVVVVLNYQEFSVGYSIEVEGRGTIEGQMDAQSIHTVVFKK